MRRSRRRWLVPQSAHPLSPFPALVPFLRSLSLTKGSLFFFLTKSATAVTRSAAAVQRIVSWPSPVYCRNSAHSILPISPQRNLMFWSFLSVTAIGTTLVQLGAVSVQAAIMSLSLKIALVIAAVLTGLLVWQQR